MGPRTSTRWTLAPLALTNDRQPEVRAQRASKDERPRLAAASRPSPTDVGFTRHRILKHASRLQPTCDGPRFARTPQGDGHGVSLAATRGTIPYLRAQPRPSSVLARGRYSQPIQPV